MDLGFIGPVADAASQIVLGFDRKGQANRLAIAQAEQAAAEANAAAATPKPKNNWIIYVIIAVVALLVLWMIFKNRS